MEGAHPFEAWKYWFPLGEPPSNGLCTIQDVPGTDKPWNKREVAPRARSWSTSCMMGALFAVDAACRPLVGHLVLHGRRGFRCLDFCDSVRHFDNVAVRKVCHD